MLSSAGLEQMQRLICSSCSQDGTVIITQHSSLTGGPRLRVPVLLCSMLILTLCIWQITNANRISAFHRLKLLPTAVPIYFHRTTAPELFHLTLYSGHPVLAFSRTCQERHCRLSWTLLVGIVRCRDKARVSAVAFFSKKFWDFSSLSVWLARMGGLSFCGWQPKDGGIQLCHILFELFTQLPTGYY